MHDVCQNTRFGNPKRGFKKKYVGGVFTTQRSMLFHVNLKKNTFRSTWLNLSELIFLTFVLYIVSYYHTTSFLGRHNKKKFVLTKNTQYKRNFKGPLFLQGVFLLQNCQLQSNQRPNGRTYLLLCEKKTFNFTRAGHNKIPEDSPRGFTERIHHQHHATTQEPTCLFKCALLAFNGPG